MFFSHYQRQKRERPATRCRRGCQRPTPARDRPSHLPLTAHTLYTNTTGTHGAISRQSQQITRVTEDLRSDDAKHVMARQREHHRYTRVPSSTLKDTLERLSSVARRETTCWRERVLQNKKK
ncbi:hypothetical protein E2C01_078230 [Portunus trituberculatus]|uniref:Uncharacterized protein n=1 Tax=Portunus trituberculatus TaxID=210409 RepID=A0A5B7IS59_PORTR|nr:hypothetical protein [Portunus trituberculatus]